MKQLQVHYRIDCDQVEVESRARALAVEQSIEMPPEAVGSDRVRREALGEVAAIAAQPDGGYRVSIALAVESSGFEAGQLINMLFGNSSLLPDVQLLDFDLPGAAQDDFGGPAHGVDGLRRRLARPAGALTCSALKPMGSSSAELAALAAQLARGGIDLIKDDHGLADQPWAPFAERVHAVQAAVSEANRSTGGRTIYAPNLCGGPQRVLEQLRQAREAGVGMVMLAPMVSGLGLMQELARDGGVPVLAHPAMAGATRIAAPALIGKLFRLCGADASIFPNHGGRFSYSAETCRQIASELRSPAGALRPGLPVPAGGMRPERVAEMRAFYGDDVMLLIGGALLAAPEGVEAAARSFTSLARAGAES